MYKYIIAALNMFYGLFCCCCHTQMYELYGRSYDLVNDLFVTCALIAQVVMRVRNFLIIVIGMSFFAACQYDSVPDDYLQQQEKIKEDYANLMFKHEDCIAQLRSFHFWLENDSDHLSLSEIKRIEDCLHAQPTYIPMEPVLGGTMFFSAVKVVSAEYVLAEFEDGHIIGRGIYRFDLLHDTILFQLIDYLQLFAD